MKLSRGGTPSITDNDMMPHQLIKLSGPAISERLVKPGSLSMGKMKAPYAAASMPHMGAVVNVAFHRPRHLQAAHQVARELRTVKTVGEDNVLRVTVVVS